MNFTGLLWGMGLLLFWLYMFEEMLKYFGWSRLKSIVLKYTTGSWQSIFIGMILAGILSSSSLLTILVIALTGAWLMPLKNAIGIVIGSNIGTTFDDFLIARLGFWMSIDFSVIALPMVGIAGIVTILTKNEQLRNLAKLFFGFGLIFIGLFFVKQTAVGIESAISLDQFQNMPLIVFWLLGMGITAVVQLMGVVAIITFTALDAGIISFPASIAILMGANMGATLNAVLSSLGWRTIKRQVALSHVLFNWISTLIGALFFRQYIRLTNTVFWFEENVVGSWFFNVIFNLSTALLFGFLLTPFTRLVEYLIPAHEQSTRLTVEQFSLSELDSDSIDATTTALSNDILSVHYLLIVYLLHRLWIHSTDLPNIGEYLQQRIFKKYTGDDETMLAQLFDEKIWILLQYYLHVSKYKLHTEQLRLLTELYKSMNALIRCKKNFDLCIPEIIELKNSKISELALLHTELINKVSSWVSALILLLWANTHTHSVITSWEFSAFESQRKDIHTEVHKSVSHLIKLNNEEIPISSLITLSMYLPLSLTHMVSASQYYLNVKSDIS